ncbi:MAG: MATE family efflux transporter [Blautia sp.]|nr:MATE family efflux transporter [Blautia sp.]
MTEGRPLPLILQFAFPLLLGNLLQQTYNIIDAAIVGRILGPNALASVGLSTSVQFLILGFCTGMCSGLGVPVARFFGAGDLKQMRSCIYHGILLAAVVAVVLTASCSLLCTWILRIMSAPEELFADAYRYLLVIFLGIPFTILYNLLAGILRSVGNSRVPFIFLAISTVLNIGLDLFCITVLGWGCAGAAIATVMSQAISGILCLVYILKKAEILHLTSDDRIFRKKDFAMMASMGIPMGLQLSVTAIGSMVMQASNNSLGAVCVSGFTAGTKIKQFAMCPFDAIGTAVSVFIGQNYGAGKPDRIKQGIISGFASGICYGIISGLVLIFFGRRLSMMFVGAGETAILDASARYLRALGFFYWGLAIVSIGRLMVQGLGHPGKAVAAGIIEMAARTVVCLLLVPRLGYTAICFADQSAWLTADVFLIPTIFILYRKVCAEFTRKNTGSAELS